MTINGRGETMYLDHRRMLGRGADRVGSEEERGNSLAHTLSEVRWQVWANYGIEQMGTEGRTVEVVRGVRGTGSIYEYYPMAFPSLPFELAKVEYGDKDGALTFVRKWGLLGVDRLQDAPEKAHFGGDPLEFIWPHAYTIQNMLRLHDGLQSNDFSKLNTAWQRFINPDVIIFEGDEGEQAGKTWFACGSGIEPYLGYDNLKGHRSSIEEGLHFAEGLPVVNAISEIVSSNIAGIRQAVYVNPGISEDSSEARVKQSRPWLSQRYQVDTLVEAIWSHLANLVTSRSSIALCKECGAYFERSDKRQLFCPPPEDYFHSKGTRVVSLCSSRYQSRQYRVRKAKKQDSGQ